MIPKLCKLKVYWSKKEKDFIISYPRKSDGSFIHWHLLSKQLISTLKKDMDLINPENKNYSYHDDAKWNNNFAYYHFDWIKELGDRGYDLTTLKFEITIKKELLESSFAHLWDDFSEKERKAILKMGFKKPKNK